MPSRWRLRFRYFKLAVSKARTELAALIMTTFTARFFPTLKVSLYWEPAPRTGMNLPVASFQV